jgi:DNA transformation protein
MSVTGEDMAYVADLFSGLGTITQRKMMGGATFYCDGQVFAILSSEGEVYLKAKDDFAAEMESAGSRIFDMGGKTMGYWTLPEDAADDADTACNWGRRALAALT